MKRAIAMKCNQEQWDAIKDKLVELNLYNISDFDYDNYLTNNWGIDYDSLSNHTFEHSNINQCEVHETWNEQIFLEACGIETERIFEGSELQYWSDFYNKWVDLESTGTTKYRLKPDYSKEIAELERQIQILKNK